MLNIIPDYDLFALGEGVSTVSMKPGKKAAAAPAAGTGKCCKRTKTAGSGARVYRVQPKSTLQLDGGPSGPMIFDGGPSGPMMYDGGPSGPMMYDGGPSGPMMV